MSRIVLASRSPARAAMLERAGVAVTPRPTEVDEAALKQAAEAAGQGVGRIAERLAAAKALAAEASPGDWVIGADQTLECEGDLFDKPQSLEEAANQLRRLRGRTHRLHSAVALARDREVAWTARSVATLQVRAFSEAFLQLYLEAEGEALLGCVGAYRLEGLGARLFERVEGDYFTVLGLPLLPLLSVLGERGAIPA